MAKKSSRSGSKHYPVHRKLNIRPLTNNSTRMEIRADYELSKANHRLYRQSRVYPCKVDISPNLVGVTLEVYALSDTWMNCNAYQEAYDQFVKNSKEERSQGNDARWNDFRVQSGVTVDGLLSAGGVEDITATWAVGNYYPGGEYLYSEVHDVTGATKRFSWTGTGVATEYNIIDEYDNMANTDATPSNPINTVGYDGLEDEMDDGQKDHLQNDGNNPPYAASSLENVCFTKIATLSANAGAGPGGQRLSTGFFNAPCGLILVKSSGPIPINTDFGTLEIKSGDYKGVHGDSMLEL